MAFTEYWFYKDPVLETEKPFSIEKGELVDLLGTSFQEGIVPFEMGSSAGLLHVFTGQDWVQVFQEAWNLWTLRIEQG